MFLFLGCQKFAIFKLLKFEGFVTWYLVVKIQFSDNFFRRILKANINIVGHRKVSFCYHVDI